MITNFVGACPVMVIHFAELIICWYLVINKAKVVDEKADNNQRDRGRITIQTFYQHYPQAIM